VCHRACSRVLEAALQKGSGTSAAAMICALCEVPKKSHWKNGMRIKLICTSLPVAEEASTVGQAGILHKWFLETAHDQLLAGSLYSGFCGGINT